MSFISKFIEHLEKIKNSINVSPKTFANSNDYYKGLHDGQNDLIDFIIDEAKNWSHLDD